jgi:hypothetical protein
MTNLDPLDAAKQDVEKRLSRLRNMAADFFKTFTTATLLKTLGGSALAIVVAALNFPVFAVVVVAVVIAALSVYAIYATKIMKEQDRENRWTYVAGKRIEQRNLDAKIAMDTATLALMGEGHTAAAMRGASSELKAALDYQKHRLRLAVQRADAAEAVKDGTATNAQRRALVRFQRRDLGRPPKGPAVEPIKARLAALSAEREELEAEIQALATAESIANAMEAEEVQGARRTRRERQEAAREADQAARERVRAGRAATAREPARTMNLRLRPNGGRDVGMGRVKPTPEQIARGETHPDAA